LTLRGGAGVKRENIDITDIDREAGRDEDIGPEARRDTDIDLDMTIEPESEPVAETGMTGKEDTEVEVQQSDGVGGMIVIGERNETQETIVIEERAEKNE